MLNSFCDLTQEEVFETNAGGVLSAIAGGMAGGIIGTVAGLIPAAIKGDGSIVVKSAITVGTAGVWAGAGFPAP